MLHFTVISLGVGTNTSSRSVSPHGSTQQHPVIFFNQKHFPFSWQTRTYGSRLVSSEIRPRAADWHLNNRRSVCVFMNCSDSVSPDEEDLGEEGMSSLLKSILTHLGQDWIQSLNWLLIHIITLPSFVLSVVLLQLNWNKLVCKWEKGMCLN